MVFPGGLKGAETMEKDSVLRLAINQQCHEGTLIAAICAAPMVLGSAGILKGKHATIYPDMEEYIEGSIYHQEAYVVEHDNIITASGPAATTYFAFAIAERLVADAEMVKQVKQNMLYEGLVRNPEPVLKFGRLG